MARGHDEVSHTIGGVDRRQVGEEAEDAAGTTQRRPPSGGPAAQRGDGDPILAREPDVAQGSRGAFGEQQFRRRARRHRRRRVDEQRDGDVLFLDEQLDEEPLESGVHVPVELPQVVTERVFAVIGELDGLAALDAPATTLEPAADRRAHDQQQPLELAQERLVEDGRVDLARQERAPGARRCRRSTGGRRRTGAAAPGFEAASGSRLARSVI